MGILPGQLEDSALLFVAVGICEISCCIFVFLIALFLTNPISKASVVGLQVMGDMRQESANCKVKGVLTQNFWMLFV